jgi:hypothetical protein
MSTKKKSNEIISKDIFSHKPKLNKMYDHVEEVGGLLIIHRMIDAENRFVVKDIYR